MSKQSQIQIISRNYGKIIKKKILCQSGSCQKLRKILKSNVIIVLFCFVLFCFVLFCFVLFCFVSSSSFVFLFLFFSFISFSFSFYVSTRALLQVERKIKRTVQSEYDTLTEKLKQSKINNAQGAALLSLTNKNYQYAQSLEEALQKY